MNGNHVPLLVGGDREGEGERGRGRGRGQGRRSGQSSHSWQQVNESTDSPPQTLPFTRTNTSSVTLTAAAAPVEFFDHFVDDEVLSLVLTETNR